MIPITDHALPLQGVRPTTAKIQGFIPWHILKSFCPMMISENHLCIEETVNKICEVKILSQSTCKVAQSAINCVNDSSLTAVLFQTQEGRFWKSSTPNFEL